MTLHSNQAAWGHSKGRCWGCFLLLLAFTVNQSATDFARHRDLLVTESNAIETAIWRADLYPDSLRALFRADFKEYIETRVAYYEAQTDEDLIRAARQQADAMAGRIWRRAAEAARSSGESLRSSQMLPAINAVIDAEARREDARRGHVPDPILALLFVLCFAGSFIVGYANKSRKIDWVVLLSYSLMTVMTVYIILDLDRPRRGLIETSAAHQNLLSIYEELEGSGR
ncbi:MAG: hypothetical protein IPI01_18975 [Ignavibacteriae bacterium]|nr:hypothetical protein [Ignavibacteriota bacterium]